jgi:hypothetical protein
MSKPFYQRLAAYFTDAGEVLRSGAGAASVFANAGDVGTSREAVYRRFLEQHAPSNCNVDFGGFVFDTDGRESRQVDIIVTASNAPRFRLHTAVDAKVFAAVDGLVGVASVKSHLDGTQLVDALENIDSIPFAERMSFPKSFEVNAEVASQIPLRVIYASSGVSLATVTKHLTAWIVDVQSQRPGAKWDRLPHIIHVAGQYVLQRGTPGKTADGLVAQVAYEPTIGSRADAIALAGVVLGLQCRSVVVNFTLPDFRPVFENMIAALAPAST